MAAYGPDLDEGLPKRSVLRTVVAAALATQPARGSVTQPLNRDGNLGRRLIQRSRWHSAPDVTAGRTASRLSARLHDQRMNARSRRWTATVRRRPISRCRTAGCAGRARPLSRGIPHLAPAHRLLRSRSCCPAGVIPKAVSRLRDALAGTGHTIGVGPSERSRVFGSQPRSVEPYETRSCFAMN